ncbi:MAG: methyltransferase [Acidobacteria bacterium]|nr:methyltransferase [Acidobacteriota bacterium]
MTAEPNQNSLFEWTKFLKGKLEILQPKKGARFSIDSVILSGFSFLRDGETAIDLGCGSGIILLLLSQFYHPKKIVGVEIQAELAYCATETMSKSGFPDYEVIEGDFRDTPQEKFDLVVSNPPFYETEKGRSSPDPLKKISRQRENLSLYDFFKSAKEYLKEDGRFSFILPYSMKVEALVDLKKNALYPYLTRGIKHKSEDPIKRFLCLCSKKEKRTIELPPIIIKDEKDGYSEEVKPFLGEVPFIENPSFFCDSMLYRLAKYLRFSGINAAYLKDADDDWLLRECSRSGRILVSLDRELINRCKKMGVKCFEPSSFSPKEQFIETMSFFEIAEKSPKRCLKCNASVKKIEKEKVKVLIPKYTYENHEDFYVCPSCSKITWGGTHLMRFKKEVLEKLNQGEENVRQRKT